MGLMNARMFRALTQENIALYQAVIPMAQGQGPAGFVKGVVPENVSAGFGGNDFNFTARPIKVIILDKRQTVAAGAHP